MKSFIQNILNKWFPKEPTFYTGANLDPREDYEKKEDWLHEELTGSSTNVFLSSKPTSFPYTIENQNQTNECGPHASTLALGTLQSSWLPRLSKDFFYRLRSNYPGAGMFLQELGSIAKNTGSCLYSSMPTSYNDVQANQQVITQELIDEAAPFKSGSYIQFGDPTNIDTLASVLASGKGVILFIYASYREWAQEYPQLLDSVTAQSAPIRHFVCALPGGQYVENNTRYLTIQDSAQFGNIAIRRLSEDFIKRRCIGALYHATLKLAPFSILRPKHTFTQHMSIGSRSVDVLFLQRVLIYEGLLPVEAATGYFGAMTFAAVKAYQSKYAKNILAPLKIDIPTGRVSTSTLNHLNSIYA